MAGERQFVWCSLLQLIVYMSFSILCASLQFDQNFTGVIFSPYVKLPLDRDDFPSFDDYTKADVKVMLELVSERFSNILIWPFTSKFENYTQNITYHSSHFVDIQIPEISAKINKERNNTEVNILQGIWQEDNHYPNIDLQLALESAQTANQIYPGTVMGFIIYNSEYPSNSTQAQQTLKYLTFLKNASEHLKLGTFLLDCGVLKIDEGKKRHDIIERILKMSDFIVCDVEADSDVKMLGAELSFRSVAGSLLEYRDNMLKINAGIQVMGSITWGSDGDTWNAWYNLENFKIYWETANAWARENSFHVWFNEAIDNPWRVKDTMSGHDGWWRLSSNAKCGQRDGYIEKVSEVNESSSKLSTDNVVSITVGLLLAMAFLSLIVFLAFRVKKLQQQLSTEDIRGFIEGERGVLAVDELDHNFNNFAMKFPYDMSYEIEIDQIKIQHDKILGTGEFGCVFNAVLKLPGVEPEHVALKQAKDACSRSALKGLLSEIKILSYVGKHPNIVALRGAYTSEIHKGIVYIATELCSLGSLLCYLKRQTEMSTFMLYANLPVILGNASYVNTNEPIKLKQMLLWSHEIACGMAYLGTKNVIHADLAARNVLLTAGKRAKISDFGLSRRIYEHTNYIKPESGPLPWRWMAVESLTRSEYSSKSDVWSYGVTLWEILTLGEIPYSNLSWTTNFPTMLINGMRLGKPAIATAGLYKFIVGCCHTNPAERPSFSDVQRKIESFLLKCKDTNEVSE